MQSSFLDRYLSGASLVHRLDPRLKLLATVTYVLAATSTPPGAWLALATLAGLALAAVGLARIPLAEALKRSSIALPFAAIVAISLPFTHGGQVVWAWSIGGLRLTITDAGLILFATVVVKSWLSVMVSGLLVATTRFPDLVLALRALRVPAMLATTISFMVRYLFVLADEAMRLMTARAARSAGKGGSLIWHAQVLGGMIGSLFIRSYERSERIYAAMVSRGFAGEMRTLTPLTWQPRDTWASLAWLLALVVVCIAGRLG
jgi:cobalt/nickel transport system permease protein